MDNIGMLKRRFIVQGRVSFHTSGQRRKATVTELVDMYRKVLQTHAIPKPCLP